jgi:hypothetical protein
MKKLVLILALVFFSATSYLSAQVIEDFEHIPLNLMLGGAEDASTMTLVANPDPVGYTGTYVIEFFRDKDGVPWGGFWSALPMPVDVTDNHYVHVWVWKPRISPIKFKLEGGPSGTLEAGSMNVQTVTNGWEEMVFDFTSMTGAYPVIALMPDFEDPLTLTEDITIYFGAIYINNDPNPASAPVYTIEDFGHIPLNLMLGGADDNSTLSWIQNPDASGINTSGRVIEFFRDMNGVPWGGFWSTLPMPVDVTTNKYVHVKVWKPRVSPIKFKLEKPGENHEIFSMNEQTLTNQWQDIVFDFSEYTGEWPTIAFMPDFEDPLTLTEDITIYFDDILVSDDPTPIGFTNVSITLDMTGAIGYGSEVPFDPALHDVFIAGDFAGWSTPGSDPSLKFTTVDNILYTLNLFLEDGHVQFKFFFVPMGEESWDNGEWTGTDNRHHIIVGGATLDLVWGDRPAMVTFNVDMTNADPFDPETDDIYISGELLSTWNQPGTVADYKLEPVTGKETIYTLTLPLYEGDHLYKYFRVIDDVPSWDNGEWTGDPNRLAAVDTTMTINDVWGSPAGIHDYSAITFNFYPNPVNDQMTIDNLSDVNRIEIYNISGEIMKTIENVSTSSVIVNTANLSKGMYMLVVYQKNEVQATKFIK